MRRFYLLAIIGILVLLESCDSSARRNPDDYFTNPVIPGQSVTCVVMYDSVYYRLMVNFGKIMLLSADDPAHLNADNSVLAVDIAAEYGMVDLWSPQLTRIGDAWYIYVTADDGNTDNHKMYVFENLSKDPTESHFVLKAQLPTDKDNNWSIHGFVFSFRDSLYMTWSGWPSRRVFAETQCIYIARMSNPWTLATERVMISEPEYEWELQWIQRDGYSFTRYPVFVNESPFFFCNDKTDKAYIYYSASGNWTTYHCIGELSAQKDANLLDPASWHKKESPVFQSNREEGIYGPGSLYIIASPDSSAFYQVYSIMSTEDRFYSRRVHMQPLEITDGKPNLGEPVSRSKRIKKISRL